MTGWRRGMSASIVVLVLVQAGLAGQFLYMDSGLVSVHRVVAEFLPLLSLAFLVLSWCISKMVTRCREESLLSRWRCLCWL